MTDDEQWLDMIRIEHAKGHILRWSPGDVGILLRLLDEREAKVAQMTKSEKVPSDDYLTEFKNWLETATGAIQSTHKTARAAALEEAARLVESHPDESETCRADPEEIRGCCEIMAEEIRALSKR